MALLPNETIIMETEDWPYRIRLETQALGSAEIVSIMLEEFASCAIALQQAVDAGTGVDRDRCRCYVACCRYFCIHCDVRDRCADRGCIRHDEANGVVGRVGWASNRRSNARDVGRDDPWIYRSS